MAHALNYTLKNRNKGLSILNLGIKVTNTGHYLQEGVQKVLQLHPLYLSCSGPGRVNQTPCAFQETPGFTALRPFLPSSPRN